MQGVLRSVQLGKAQPLLIQGRSIQSAIRKQPFAGDVMVAPLGLAGDEQVDLSVHGGLEKAIYAYPTEHYAFWNHERQQAGVAAAPMGFGGVGENLSIAGLNEAEVWVGDLLRFPRCVLRVTQPREPCYKFNAVMGFSQASKRMAQSGHCGFYLAVEQGGALCAGETFTLEPGPRTYSIAQRFATKMGKHLRD
ncbi:MOSC domain-containing protein [Curvibacter sp. APW13]|uniref:MOSC domain-containing protein n=1 Tax=Curvibacter sp. APW13 TaxID=3077236 RepID=UPI0028DFB433|nr:MOSC domain-containing protein [Curvibacter sp. APW13]MDT8991669.1 MOSC domain-containing protein [Curvibacter sp. APW13]